MIRRPLAYEDLCLFMNPDDTHPFQLAVFQDEFDFDILLGFRKYKWILRNLTMIPQAGCIVVIYFIFFHFFSFFFSFHFFSFFLANFIYFIFFPIWFHFFSFFFQFQLKKNCFIYLSSISYFVSFSFFVFPYFSFFSKLE